MLCLEKSEICYAGFFDKSKYYFEVSKQRNIQEESSYEDVSLIYKYSEETQWKWLAESCSKTTFVGDFDGLLSYYGGMIKHGYERGEKQKVRADRGYFDETIP